MSRRCLSRFGVMFALPYLSLLNVLFHRKHAVLTKIPEVRRKELCDSKLHYEVIQACKKGKNSKIDRPRSEMVVKTQLKLKS